MTDRIAARLGMVPEEFTPIARHARLLLSTGAREHADGAIEVGHLGKEAYAVRVFPPVPDADLDQFEQAIAGGVPAAWRTFVRSMNGCSIHGLRLFGVPALWTPGSRLHDRSGGTVRAFDIVAANKHWWTEYAPPKGHGWTAPGLHFGGRDLDEDKQLGYFWGADTIVAFVRRSGEAFGAWPDLSSLLRDELPAAVEQALTADDPIFPLTPEMRRLITGQVDRNTN